MVFCEGAQMTDLGIWIMKIMSPENKVVQKLATKQKRNPDPVEK